MWPLLLLKPTDYAASQMETLDLPTEVLLLLFLPLRSDRCCHLVPTLIRYCC